MTTPEKTMTCVYCGRRKTFDGFPSRSTATCWSCAWNDHIASDHKRIGRRIRRQAKKRARRISERDVVAAMFNTERQQVLGLRIDPEEEAR